jgi:hypothetical protein
MLAGLLIVPGYTAPSVRPHQVSATASHRGRTGQQLAPGCALRNVGLTNLTQSGIV